MDTFDFNTTPSTFYGVTFLEGVYAELQKPAKAKDGIVVDWIDQNGKQRDLTARTLETRTLVLPVLLEGNNETDFLNKLEAFETWYKNAGYFDFKVYRMNRKYKLCYSEVTEFKGYYDHCTFNLVLFDDYPHLKQAI